MSDLMVKVIYVLLIFLPCLGSPMTVYFIDEVLRYRLKHKKTIYIFAFVVAALAGLFFTFFGGYYGEVKEAIIITDLPMLLLSLFMMIVIGFNIKEKWYKRIAVVFFATSIITDLGSIFGGLREEINLLGVTDNHAVISLRYLGYEVLILVLEFLLFVAIARVRRKRDDVPLPMPVLIAMFFILTLFTSLLPSDYADTTILRSSSPSIIMLILSALAFVTLLFYVRVTRKERNDLAELNSRNEEYIEAEAKFFELSAKADTEIRAMRHDMKNNVQVLMLLLENGEYDKMRDYLEEMGGNLTAADVSSHTGNTIADAIIADKKRKASEAGAELIVSGVISGVEFTPVDLCKILANILDNAIEAVSEEALSDVDPEFKKIELIFKRTDKFFMISLTNPCLSCPVIVDGQIETHKNDKKNHGFGIANAKEAAANYGGELSVECEPKSGGFVFRTEILFDLKEE
ncbi:MAG: GHKL domain-containing protein [Clostridiales bacterium]|nr:GHKL domain-containing protein [Clostridiales bacterium]